MRIFQDINKQFNTNFKSDREIDWSYISEYYYLSEDFIEKYKKYLNWIKLSLYQKLSEKFIEKHKNEVDWEFISSYQFLSESFIEKYQKHLDWRGISKFQKLSKEFIEKHKDKINFKHLKYNVLTQTNIGKDWFFAYMPSNYLSFDKPKNKRCLFFTKPSNNSIRVKIYYKDLIFTNETEKAKTIRKCNQYKISGKKDESI